MMTPSTTHSKTSITRKIVLLLLISGVFPLMIVAVVFFSFYYKGHKHDLFNIQREISDRVATSISAHLEKTYGQIQLFAGSLDLEISDEKDLKYLLDALMDQIVEFDAITIANNEGDEICKVSRYYTFRPFEFEKIAHKKLFQIAQSGKIHIDKVKISQFSQFPYIEIAAPIRDIRDKVRGVLIVGVNVMKMWSDISKHSIGAGRYAYVVDSDGFLIAFRDASSVLQKRNLRDIEGVARLLNDEIGVFEYPGLTGETVIGANALIPLTGWGVIVETAVKDAYASQRLLSVLFGGLFLFTLGLMAFLGFRFSFKSIIKPIGLLKKEAEAIAQGQFGRKINLTSKDELGQLAGAFNRMSENLDSTTVSRDLLVQEISDHKKTEKALKKSEATLKGIFRTAPIGIGLASERVFLWVNQHLSCMLAYTADELVGQSVRMVYPSQAEFERIGREKADQIKKDGTATVETQWRRKDGAIIDVLLSTTFLSESDLSSNVTFTALDITDRKRAEEALRASGEIVRSIPSGLFVYQYEPEDRLILLDGNPAAKELTGIDINASRGREFNEIWPQAYESGVTQAFLDVMKTGRIYSSEDLTYEDERIQGAFRIVAFRMTTKRLGVAFENITAKKQAELERQNLEEQLLQARKMEAVGSLAGGIAHEFNNILAVVLGNAELALEDLEDLDEFDSVTPFLNEIRTASLRAKDVVTQILNFARKMPSEQKAVKISDVVEESLKLIRATMPTSIQVQHDFLGDDAVIFADPSDINQILINLCSNAVDAMQDETGVLEIRLETVRLNASAASLYENLSAGGYVKLSVKDNGEGIAPDIISRIFEPYFTTKSVEKGLGMGLAVVYGTVKKHDGAVKVVSKLGQGTTFEVLFPIIEEESATDQTSSEDLPLGSERILFVDDEAALVKIGQQILEKQGYAVVGETSSEEALKRFQADPDRYDLVISDMAMPSMTGDRLAREIFKIRPNMPIILCTGHSDRFDENNAHALGIKAYTKKPLIKADLLKMVRNVLDQANGSSSRDLS